MAWLPKGQTGGGLFAPVRPRATHNVINNKRVCILCSEMGHRHYHVDHYQCVYHITIYCIMMLA